MKQIVAINASPRANWNTGTLVKEAAKGAQAAGAEVKEFHLYRLEKLHGCVSCFACKRPGNEGRCIHADDLAPVLEAIRHADGLILGSPNYLANTSYAFRALYERLIFQYITYKKEISSYNPRKIPVLFIMTSNVPVEFYEQRGYDSVVREYQEMFDRFIGPTQVLLSGDTLQVEDYEPFQWTGFDPVAKKRRHETEFPKEKEAAFQLGRAMAE